MTEHQDLVSLAEAIGRGEITLPPLKIDNTDPYYQSMTYILDCFGKRGPREVVTGLTKSRMIPVGKQLLINEDYLHMYCS